LTTARTSQSGLVLAYRRGKLDGHDMPALQLLETGYRYQDAYEAAAGMLTPVRHEVRGTLVSTGQEATFAAAIALKRLRAPLSADHVAVLDSVCGEGRTVYSTAQGARRHAHTIERLLREGLAAATVERQR